MSAIETQDGTEIFYKDWGSKDAQPIVFHHGWPLSSDDWDTQMLFFVKQGYRVIAHDRRGHGRSTQTADGHDMDTYAADVAALVSALDLQNVIHVGHSTGGGEATRYVAPVNEQVRLNWWRQAMMGAINAQYECVKAFSETNCTEDLKSIDVPVLIMHGEDDQIVPIAITALVAAKLAKNSTLKVYPGLPHGMATTHAERINADLLAFIKADQRVLIEA